MVPSHTIRFWQQHSVTELSHVCFEDFQLLCERNRTHVIQYNTYIQHMSLPCVFMYGFTVTYSNREISGVSSVSFKFSMFFSSEAALFSFVFVWLKWSTLQIWRMNLLLDSCHVRKSPSLILLLSLLLWLLVRNNDLTPVARSYRQHSRRYCKLL